MLETWWLVAAKIRSSPTAIVVAIAAEPTIGVRLRAVVDGRIVREQRRHRLRLVVVEMKAVAVDQVGDLPAVGEL